MLETLSGWGSSAMDFMGGAANSIGNMFTSWGTPKSAGTSDFASGGMQFQGGTSDLNNMDVFNQVGYQSPQPGGVMAMPTAMGGTGDIANSAGELGAFKSGLTPTGFFGESPAGSIKVGDYAMTPEQFAAYGDLGKRYGQGYVDQFLGIKGADTPSWFTAKGVPLSKMALAGGSLYLGSKTADAFKKQMEASAKVAQQNLENQTALINTYMYDRQAARYAADPASQQTPEEYMAEHGL